MCFRRLNSNIQQYLIRHPGCIKNWILTLFYNVDVVLYSVVGAVKFLSARAEALGPNYCALGRVIIGDYEQVVDILQNPQQRSFFLGRARLIPDRMPANFLLFLSDAEATPDNDQTHALLHSYIWERVIPPAQSRVEESSDVFHQYVLDAITEYRNKGSNAKDAPSIIQTLAIKYIMHALFDIVVTDDQLETLRTLFYTFGRSTSFIINSMKPLASLSTKKVDGPMNAMVDLVEASELLQSYEPSADNANVSRRHLAELLMVMAGVAGFVGVANLATSVLTKTPGDYPIDTNDGHQVLLAVLETARCNPPVNNINIVLEEPRTFKMSSGQEVTFPTGTVVAGSIGLASLDEMKFPNPHEFDPKRPDLMDSILNFNGLGYSPAGAGKRLCPGRNIAISLCTDVLVTLRNTLKESAE